MRCGSEYKMEKGQLFPTKTRKSNKWIKSNALLPLGKYTELTAKPAVMKGCSQGSVRADHCSSSV